MHMRTAWKKEPGKSWFLFCYLCFILDAHDTPYFSLYTSICLRFARALLDPFDDEFLQPGETEKCLEKL